jgi:hypothetical protein
MRSLCGREHVYDLSMSNEYLTHVELGIVVYHSLALLVVVCPFKSVVVFWTFL